jgi:hypothetical protein
VKTATKSFRFEDAYGGGEVVEGERIADDHELVRLYPECWRNFGLDEELQIRSDRVADLATRDFTASSTQPLSRAGREAREQDGFWRSTMALLERTRDDLPPSEERREQAHFDQAIAQLEPRPRNRLPASRDYDFLRH